MSQTPVAVVDAASGCVRAGERSWTFELDLREGVATLELEGGPTRVRPLLWGEKVRLARFAGVDEGLLEEQFLRLSLHDASEMAQGTAEREAVAALALWLNAPHAAPETGTGLPLESSLLAAVTLEVCRAIGLGPADLEGREAPEVEALWHAAEAQPPAAATRFASALPGGSPTTRILVVPDAADDNAADDTRVEPAPGATAGAGATRAETTFGQDLEQSPGSGTALRDEQPAPAGPRRLADRLRPVALDVAAAGARLAPTGVVGSRPETGPAATLQVNDAAPPTARPIAPEAASRWTDAQVATLARESPSSSWLVDGRLDAPGFPPPVTFGLAHDEREALLDDLGRRLELAAAELGIDTER